MGNKVVVDRERLERAELWRSPQWRRVSPRSLLQVSPLPPLASANREEVCVKDKEPSTWVCVACVMQWGEEHPFESLISLLIYCESRDRQVVFTFISLLNFHLPAHLCAIKNRERLLLLKNTAFPMKSSQRIDVSGFLRTFL